jgi:hypothetical protein
MRVSCTGPRVWTEKKRKEKKRKEKKRKEKKRKLHPRSRTPIRTICQ